MDTFNLTHAYCLYIIRLEKYAPYSSLLYIMSIYQQLHQIIVLFLLHTLYIDTLSIYIYIENIIIPILPLKLVSKYIC